MKTKSKKLLLALIFMTCGYAVSFTCYGFILTSDSTSSPSGYFFIGLTCLLMAVAWLATLIEYKIEKLKEELLSTSEQQEAKTRLNQSTQTTR
jgi:hypothetical protein